MVAQRVRLAGVSSQGADGGTALPALPELAVCAEDGAAALAALGLPPLASLPLPAGWAPGEQLEVSCLPAARGGGRRRRPTPGAPALPLRHPHAAACRAGRAAAPQAPLLLLPGMMQHPLALHSAPALAARTCTCTCFLAAWGWRGCRAASSTPLQALWRRRPCRRRWSFGARHGRGDGRPGRRARLSARRWAWQAAWRRCAMSRRYGRLGGLHQHPVWHVHRCVALGSLFCAPGCW